MLGFGNDSVLVGRDGRLFYLGDSAVRQSAGLLVRDRGVADTLDFLAAMNDDLERRGIRFLVASPPNAATVYQERPAGLGARPRAGRTEYDLFVDGPRGQRRQDRRFAAGHGRGQGRGADLLPPRQPLDAARRARGLQLDRGGGRPSRLAARSGFGLSPPFGPQGRRSRAHARRSGQRHRGGRRAEAAGRRESSR